MPAASGPGGAPAAGRSGEGRTFASRKLNFGRLVPEIVQFTFVSEERPNVTLHVLDDQVFLLLDRKLDLVSKVSDRE